MRKLRRGAILLLILALAACGGNESPAPTTSPAASGPVASGEVTPVPSVAITTLAPATAVPEPPLSLALPAEADERAVSFTISPDVPTDADGTLTVAVTNGSDARIDEIVLRWATELDATLFLAPFARDPARIVDGGQPLVQDWTKWVIGPGERGEPEGTTSLGWGPLDAGATLEIPILVTRRADGPVSFDLQFLAGNAILTADGEAAETRVEIP